MYAVDVEVQVANVRVCVQPAGRTRGMLLIWSQVLYLSKIRNGEGYERVAGQDGSGEDWGLKRTRELMRSDEGKTKDGKLGQCWSLKKQMCMQEWMGRRSRVRVEWEVSCGATACRVLWWL